MDTDVPNATPPKNMKQLVFLADLQKNYNQIRQPFSDNETTQCSRPFAQTIPCLVSLLLKLTD